jgi:FkbM family methyltransferase
MTSITFESAAQTFCRKFAAAAPQHRFVLGRGDYAASIAETVTIAAFIDDFARDDSFLGRPIVRSKDLPDGALVVVASMLRPRSALASLAGLPIQVLDYFAFERFTDLPVKPVTFWAEFRNDYAANRDRYDKIRARLADTESVEIFDGIVNFRLTADLTAMAETRYDMVNQYFEDFLSLARDGESFVDVGCYDGATSIEFARRCPGFRHITAFEPAAENFGLVTANLTPLGDDRLTLHNCGLSDAPGTLSFDAGHGSSNRVSAQGSTTVRVQRLDDVAIHSATFLKMDIEGAEIAALSAGIDTIRRFRPRLAISVYHRAADFWQIPELIDKAGVPYELRMRHYTEGIDETVMFFLPTDGPC